MSSQVHAREAQLRAEDDWDTAAEQRTRTVGHECTGLGGEMKGRGRTEVRQEYSRDRGAARVKEKQREKAGNVGGGTSVVQ